MPHAVRKRIPCWDENALAGARRYDQLSPAVGVLVLGHATRAWIQVVGTVPEDRSVSHGLFGSLRAIDLMRRNAHEVNHHV
ncbi:MAG: hypothetical protein M3Y91_12260 [Actinomycetota bacterium]|nr:hypothetical protein [Actinomycetota bacterium]